MKIPWYWFMCYILYFLLLAEGGGRGGGERRGEEIPRNTSGSVCVWVWKAEWQFSEQNSCRITIRQIWIKLVKQQNVENNHSAVQTQTQTQPELEAYWMHAIVTQYQRIGRIRVRCSQEISRVCRRASISIRSRVSHYGSKKNSNQDLGWQFVI